MLAIIGGEEAKKGHARFQQSNELPASGKLGGATLSALLSHKLVEPSSIVAITSSSAGSAKWEGLAALGVE